MAKGVKVGTRRYKNKGICVLDQKKKGKNLTDARRVCKVGKDTKTKGRKRR